MKYQKLRRKEKGQSVVEFAMVVPLLILLMLGIAEVGYAFYSYMVLANANREAVRFAARGRYTAQDVTDRVLIAGGTHQKPDGSFESNLRTTGTDANIGIIVTYIPIDSDGNLDLDDIEANLAGVTQQDDEIKAIEGGDTRVTGDVLAEYQNKYGPITRSINTYRNSENYEPQNNEVVIVETFMLHERLFDFELNLFAGDNTAPNDPTFSAIIPNPLPLYFRSAMRVMRSR
ncbi:MAG: pilus assembly protein [Anaerolineae bacterium]|nr:pilus assembly protein [Anaerolineae bacterium]